MTKNQSLYGNTTTRCGALHLDMVHSFQGEAQKKKAQRLYEILSQADKKTIYGDYIRTGLSDRGMGSFRQLINELKDQCRDARNGLISAIGIEAVTLLESIS